MIPTGATVLPVLSPRRTASADRPLVVWILRELCGNGQQHFQGEHLAVYLSLTIFIYFLLQVQGKSGRKRTGIERPL